LPNSKEVHLLSRQFPSELIREAPRIG